jgi:hypothetical protein
MVLSLALRLLSRTSSIRNCQKAPPTPTNCQEGPHVNEIGKKDHISMAVGLPGNTWNIPPLALAAGPATILCGDTLPGHGHRRAWWDMPPLHVPAHGADMLPRHPTSTANGGMSPSHPAAIANGGMTHHRRHPATIANGGTSRHHPAATANGGRCHVSPGKPCRHTEVVLFGNFMHRWSFLTIRWDRWSFLSKFPSSSQITYSHCITCHLLLPLIHWSAKHCIPWDSGKYCCTKIGHPKLFNFNQIYQINWAMHLRNKLEQLENNPNNNFQQFSYQGEQNMEFPENHLSTHQHSWTSDCMHPNYLYETVAPGVFIVSHCNRKKHGWGGGTIRQNSYGLDVCYMFMGQMLVLVWQVVTFPNHAFPWHCTCTFFSWHIWSICRQSQYLENSMTYICSYRETKILTRHERRTC